MGLSWIGAGNASGSWAGSNDGGDVKVSGDRGRLDRVERYEVKGLVRSNNCGTRKSEERVTLERLSPSGYA